MTCVKEGARREFRNLSVSRGAWPEGKPADGKPGCSKPTEDECCGTERRLPRVPQRGTVGAQGKQRLEKARSACFREMGKRAALQSPMEDNEKEKRRSLPPRPKGMSSQPGPGLLLAVDFFL